MDIKERKKYMLLIKNTHYIKKKSLIVRKGKKYDASTNQEQFGMIIVVSDKANLRKNNIKNNKSYCIC